MSASGPFHRLLTFFARRSPRSDGQTITFVDSLKGDLSLGLNAPLSFLLATVRHLVFRTSGFAIHVPSVRSNRVLLGGPGALDVEESRRYTRGELLRLAGRSQRGGGLIAQGDALGLWLLAASRTDGKVSGEEVRLFQRGELFEHLADRRRGRSDVLPFWRGGPIKWVPSVRQLTTAGARSCSDGCETMVC